MRMQVFDVAAGPTAGGPGGCRRAVLLLRAVADLDLATRCAAWNQLRPYLVRGPAVVDVSGVFVAGCGMRLLGDAVELAGRHGHDWSVVVAPALLRVAPRAGLNTVPLYPSVPDAVAGLATGCRDLL